METIAIEMPKALAEIFVKHLAEYISGRYSCAGCNDVRVSDTPENRAVVAQSDLHAVGEEYPPYASGGKLVGNDMHLFDYFAKHVKDAVEATK